MRSLEKEVLRERLVEEAKHEHREGGVGDVEHSQGQAFIHTLAGKRTLHWCCMTFMSVFLFFRAEVLRIYNQ